MLFSCNFFPFRRRSRSRERRGGDRRGGDRRGGGGRDRGGGRDNRRFQPYGRGGDRREMREHRLNFDYCVFVSNVPYELRWQDLKDMIKEEGECKQRATQWKSIFV